MSMNAPLPVPAAQPTPALYDLAQARLYIATLTGDPVTPVLWQTFPEPKGGDTSRSPQTLVGVVDELFDQLCEISDAGHGIFVAVNEVNGSQRKSSNIVRVRAVFADEDEKDGRSPLDVSTLSPPPTMVVRSGGGRHVYWNVSDAALEAFTPTQRAIAARLGTDPKVSDLARVMRCPGFPHLKDRSNPRPVFFLEVQSNATYALDEVLSGLGADLDVDFCQNRRIEPTPSTRLVLSSGDEVLRAREYLKRIVALQGQGGDLATFKAAAALVRNFALDEATAWQLLREWNMTNCLPSWTEAELRQKLASARRNGKHALGAALAADGGLPAANEPMPAVTRGARVSFIAERFRPMTVAELEQDPPAKEFVWDGAVPSVMSGRSSARALRGSRQRPSASPSTARWACRSSGAGPGSARASSSRWRTTSTTTCGSWRRGGTPSPASGTPPSSARTSSPSTSAAPTCALSGSSAATTSRRWTRARSRRSSTSARRAWG
jgi:hypothetical protein